jgi:hypothetical protein
MFRLNKSMTVDNVQKQNSLMWLVMKYTSRYAEQNDVMNLNQRRSKYACIMIWRWLRKKHLDLVRLRYAECNWKVRTNFENGFPISKEENMFVWNMYQETFYLWIMVRILHRPVSRYTLSVTSFMTDGQAEEDALQGTPEHTCAWFFDNKQAIHHCTVDGCLSDYPQLPRHLWTDVTVHAVTCRGVHWI